MVGGVWNKRIVAVGRVLFRIRSYTDVFVISLALLVMYWYRSSSLGMVSLIFRDRLVSCVIFFVEVDRIR